MSSGASWRDDRGALPGFDRSGKRHAARNHSDRPPWMASTMLIEQNVGCDG